MTESLLSRLEKATGPSRELDAEIALANGWQKPDTSYSYWTGPRGEVYGAPWNYTASIDAALTLVPEGQDWIIALDNARGIGFYAAIDKTAHTAATPAIALLLAIEKAKGEF